MRPARRANTWAVAVILAVSLGSGAARAEDEALLRQLQSRVEALEKRLTTAPPPADASPSTDRIRQLLERIEALERAVNSSAAPKSGVTPSGKPDNEAGWVEVGKDLDLRRNIWDHGARFETADGAFRFHLGGRMDFDNTWYKPSGLPFVLDDGSDFRRARLRADGTLWELIDFAAELNFANIQDINAVNATVPVGSVGLRDFWVQFKRVPAVGDIRVGHVKPPISLERMTSSNVWYYLERSPGHDAFLNPFEYANGVMFLNAWLGERVTGAAAFCKVGRQTINPFGFDAGDGQYGAFGRVTALPVYADEGRTLVHVGVGAFHIDPDGNSLATGDRPLVRAGGGNQIPDLLQTGTYFTPDGVTVATAETAMVLGPFSLSAEYTVAAAPNVFSAFDGVRFSGPRGSAIYHAAYVEAGLFLTPGDYRRYDRTHGVWGRTVPAESAFLVRGDGGVCWGRGAVQLLCRYTHLDLASGDPVLTTTSGAGAGREDDLTVGLACYLNPQTNVQVNYVYTKLRYVNGTAGDFHGLGCRVHLDF
jgi:phosphate-selective porin OprO and OprP